MQTIKISVLISILSLTCSAFSREAVDMAALKQLLDGNARFVSGRYTHPHQDGQRRAELSAVQRPFAVVLACADSRVSPEIIFDQGLGDLFVVRVAGNIVDDVALGSVEFAVTQLGARLVMVLGHERCGAVKAAVGVVNGAPVPAGHIGGIVEAIKPAVEASKSKEGDPVENALRENVQRGVEKLEHSGPLLEPLVKSGELKVVGARYDLDDGNVEILP